MEPGRIHVVLRRENRRRSSMHVSGQIASCVWMSHQQQANENEDSSSCLTILEINFQRMNDDGTIFGVDAFVSILSNGASDSDLRVQNPWHHRCSEFGNDNPSYLRCYPNNNHHRI